MSDQQAPQESPHDAASMQPSKVNVGRVSVIASVAVILFVLALMSVFFDWPSKFRAMTRPSLVPGSGRVTWEGFPVAGGTIMIQPVDRDLQGSVGFIGMDGSFKFQTDFEGRYVDGAFPGDHKATVVHFGVNYPLGAPPATPLEYSEFEDSPLTLTISKTPAENVYNIDIKGEPTRGNSIPEVLGLEMDEPAGDSGEETPGDEAAADPPAGDEPAAEPEGQPAAGDAAADSE